MVTLTLHEPKFISKFAEWRGGGLSLKKCHVTRDHVAEPLGRQVMISVVD